MNVITVQDVDGKALCLAQHIEKTLRITAKKLKLSNVEIDVSLVSDNTMKSLNRKYRGKNKPTDVLSFSQEDMVVKKRRHLGDIIIAKETTRKQATAAGKTVHEEFSMLAIHGLLHLLGYDHEKKKDEVVMFGLQNKLLAFSMKYLR